MKSKIWILTAIIVILTSGSVYAKANKIPVYRVYSPTTMEHLFTPDLNEVKVLSGREWRNEGIAWYSYDREVTGPTSGWYTTGMTGVKRLFNSAVGEHLYTRNPQEIQVLTQRGWKLDFNGQPLFHDADSFYAGYSVFRLYNPSIKRHHLTIDYNERTTLQQRGWKNEGVVLNVFKN